MDTEVLRGDDPRSLVRAVELLVRGSLVAFPTETVYGLGADARSERGVRAIFEAKGRPDTNPLIVHVRSLEAARSIAYVSLRAERLAEAFWPGPVTMVLESRGVLPSLVTAGGPTVALRCPRHPAARALLLAFGGPIAAPSANRSGGISPTSAEDVVTELGGRVPLVLDGGPCAVGIESTVIDLVGPSTILRPGTIPASEIARALEEPVGWGSETAGPERSPGRLGRHYAPTASVVVGGTPPNGAAILRRGGGERNERVFELPDEPSGFARELYSALRRADRLGVDVIWIEPVPQGEAWDGVRDRLRRASLRE